MMSEVKDRKRSSSQEHGANSNATNSQKRQPNPAADQFVANTTKVNRFASDATAVIENDKLRLDFDPLSGLLASVTHKESGVKVRVSMGLTYWESRRDPPFGGAYIMRPDAQVLYMLVVAWILLAV
jgi:hypothetical protein